MIREAAHWDKLEDNKVQCRLCPAGCELTEGKVGNCTSRSNQGGRLVTDNYGELVTLAIDPIEKKPLYHFYPTASILSTGANGCNLKCLHCQNWTISQRKTRTSFVSPEQLAQAAGQQGSIGVAFTYTEPVIWFEYIMDVAPLLRQRGLKVVLVSNGYINPGPLEDLIGVMDAINVDLKAMRPQFYKRICKGQLEPVLAAIRRIAQSDVHLELTNLIIPDENDSDSDLRELVEFVASIDELIPLHFSAFHPDNQLMTERTPAETMLRARDVAARRLKHVFLGNIALEGTSDSHCPHCGHLLVQRDWYRTEIVGMDGNRCRKCGSETGIVR